MKETDKQPNMYELGRVFYTDKLEEARERLTLAEENENPYEILESLENVENLELKLKQTVRREELLKPHAETTTS